jgi:hypothetical protein
MITDRAWVAMLLGLPAVTNRAYATMHNAPDPGSLRPSFVLQGERLLMYGGERDIEPQQSAPTAIRSAEDDDDDDNIVIINKPALLDPSLNLWVSIALSGQSPLNRTSHLSLGMHFSCAWQANIHGSSK